MRSWSRPRDRRRPDGCGVKRAAEATRAPAPGWVAAALGGDLVDVARLPWGFTNETWGATNPAGERHAATRMATREAAAFVLERGPEIARRAAAAGLKMPVPIATRSDAAAGVVVSAWIDGTPAMRLLVDADGATVVGTAIAAAWRRLRMVDVDGLELDATWASPARLAAAATAWCRTITGLDPAATAGAHRAIELVAALPATEPASFVHGDLVPANLLLRPGGDVLLDLEAARIGDGMLDAAWFRWIVGYHHPGLVAAAWSAFADAAGLPAGVAAGGRVGDATPGQGPAVADRTVLDAYPVLRILEILATSRLDSDAQGRWLAQLEAAIEPFTTP